MAQAEEAKLRMPTPSELTELSQLYESSVRKLAHLKDPLPADLVLKILCVRDAIHTFLQNRKPQYLDLNSISTLIEADKALLSILPRIVSLPEVTAWQTSLAPQASAWWWFAGEEEGSRWRPYILIFGCLSASFIMEVAKRLGTNSLDQTGALLIILPTALTALSAGGALSKTIESALRTFLSSFHIPAHKQRATLAGVSALICLCAIGTWLFLPQVSKHYNNKGASALAVDRLAEAEAYLQLALKISPANTQAHYNMGQLLERLQRHEDAIREYSLAMSGGLDVSANNLARLLLLHGKPDVAAQILLQSEESTRRNDTEPYVRYHILKNLAWARIEQGRAAEATALLNEAVFLVPRAAPAYCLAGRAFTQIGDREKAATAWAACLSRARTYEPDEDRWMSEADKFFGETQQ
jgi:tetratricopeptide (TPR) repeat protein